MNKMMVPPTTATATDSDSRLRRLRGYHHNHRALNGEQQSLFDNTGSSQIDDRTTTSFKQSSLLSTTTTTSATATAFCLLGHLRQFLPTDPGNRHHLHHWHLNLLHSQASSSNDTAAHCFDGAIAGVGDDDDNA